ncbi:hypothetical protein [Rhodococcus qingshengii]|jgi:hypothetical protein|uniref:hypothetical protein n=1 Tax=Rhodococcus qingshengii TaxID=334542 RepID=UPI00301754A3
MSETYPAELYDGCPCLACLGYDEQWKMALCPTCGNKRCKGAIHHVNHRKPSEESL